MIFFNRWLSNIRKHAAIGTYLRKLPKRLAADYGASTTYTPSQLKKTIQRANLNADYSCYAYAMFCTPADFNQYHTTTGENCDYTAMRTEIANTHFNGNTAFSSTDIDAKFADTHHGAGGHNGGHHSSGDGGGGHH